MKVWQKIMVAPGVAILFLVVLGALSYINLTRQQSTLGDLYNDRFGNYQLAANSAQAISEVHSNVYRLFTWISNIEESKVQQITNEQKARIEGVTKSISQFAAGSGLVEEERTLAESILKQLGKYKGDLETAIDLSTVDVSTGMSAMQTADGGFQELIKDFDKLVKLEKKLAQRSYESAGQAFSKVVVALFVVLLLAISISSGMAFFMSRKIVRECAARATPVHADGVELDRTGFYYESGGQPGDTGELVLADGRRVPVTYRGAARPAPGSSTSARRRPTWRLARRSPRVSTGRGATG